MVCVAAFIILCILSVFVGALSIFRRDIGKKYWVVFGKSWGCVAKRVTFRKCDTKFKDDIKNSVLKKVILKRPKWVKPISIGIEVTSVLIVLITVWSLIEGAKAGLALYALGSCNVQQPNACVVGNVDVCPANEGINWFQEWGVIFAAIPDRWRDWNADNFMPEQPVFRTFVEGRSTAIDILDPGCDICLQSYRNQLAEGFFDRQNVVLIPFPTAAATRDYRYHNSYLVSTYILAAHEVWGDREGISAGWQILDKLFMDSGMQGEIPVIYQAIMKADYTSEEDARELMEGWLAEFGMNEEEVARVRELADSDSVKQRMEANRDLVKNRIRITGVPTLIFNGRKHTGVFTGE